MSSAMWACLIIANIYISNDKIKFGCFYLAVSAMIAIYNIIKIILN